MAGIGIPVARTSGLQNQIIALLPPDDRERMFADCSLVILRLTQQLYGIDDRVDAIYFPLDSVVSLLVGAGDDTKVEMATIGNEGVVGIFSILCNQEALADHVVQLQGEALRMPTASFQKHIRDNKLFHDLLHRYLYALTAQIVQAGACNRLHTMEERCARWLLMMHDRSGKDSFPMTQEFLAGMLGVRRGTINISLRKLKGASLIEYVRGRILVRNRKGLESASCSCYEIIRQKYRALARA
jgi:CRP-like cAMP-binding protein